MIGPFEFAAAFLLDAAIGDPRFMPHPVRIIGGAITFLEGLLRRIFGRKHEKAAGVVLAFLIVITSGLSAALFVRLLGMAESSILSMVSSVVLIYISSTTLALRELAGAAWLVIASIKKGDLFEARGRLSMIVGRDTCGLSEEGVLRATIETLSENLSDGVIAPMFYLVIGGLPLAIAYKAVNTLDSMVGYKNVRYISFGWSSAKLDDIANYIPARISGLLIAVSAFFVSFFRRRPDSLLVMCNSLRIMARDGMKHTSPNSGMPEAAMAGALGVRLGGPSSYEGRIVEKPYIGDKGNNDYLAASSAAVRIVIVSSIFAAAAGSLALYIRESI